MDTLNRFFFISILFTVFIIGKTSAQSDILLETRISIDAQNIPLGDVIEMIEKQSSVQFMYKSSLFPDEEKVSISAEDKSIEELLNELFENYYLKFTEYQDFIIIAKEKGQTSIVKLKKKPKTVPEPKIDPIKEPIEPIATIPTAPVDTIKPHVIDSNFIKEFNTIHKSRIRTLLTFTIDSSITKPTDSIGLDSAYKAPKPIEMYFSVGLNMAYLFPFTGSEIKITNDVEFSQRLGSIYTGGLETMFHVNKWGIGIGVNWTTMVNKLTSDFQIDSLVYKKVITVVDSFGITDGVDSNWTYLTNDDSYFKDTLVDDAHESRTYYHYYEFPLTLSFDVLETEKSRLSLTFSYMPGLLNSTTYSTLDSNGFIDDNSAASVYEISQALALGLVSNVKVAHNWEMGFYTSFKKYITDVFVQSYHPRSKGYYVNMGAHLTYNFKPKRQPNQPSK
ncbi:MAG: hypothetical protein HRT71_12140 [Flavobacteriales bacterium]|nr:hypothetical protein [Flavobacteriales bacterium]